MTAFLQYEKSYFSEKSLKFEILAFFIITYDVFGLEVFFGCPKEMPGIQGFENNGEELSSNVCFGLTLEGTFCQGCLGWHFLASKLCVKHF